MPTNRKRVARRPIIHEEPLSEALEYYFIHGNSDFIKLNLRGDIATFKLMKHRDKMKELWLKYRKQILAKNKDAWAEENL